MSNWNSIISDEISAAQQYLECGEVVGIPTETVYGLAANALNKEAIVKIFEAKNRPYFDPLIVHIGDGNQLPLYAKNISDKAQHLAAKFWPGPLTLVLERQSNIPDLITSGLDTVGLRMPNHPIALKLLAALNFPLAAPSANPFGYISPTTSQHVMDQLNGKIPLVLDGGPCTIGVESTILRCVNNEVTLLRLGALALEQIEAEVGQIRIEKSNNSNPMAPGMLASHYAPKKPLVVGNIESLLETHSHQKIAVLSFHKTYPATFSRRLSASQNLNEAAQNLFAMLRELDKSDADVILTENLPEIGLGRAINDRLKRAAFKIL